MLVPTLLFGVTAFVVVMSALLVITHRNPVYSALFLVLTFLGLAAFYLQLSATFIAAVQVIVYAGAIMVLFVFVLMLLGESQPLAGERRLGMPAWLGVLVALVLLAEIGYMLWRVPAHAVSLAAPRVAVVAAAGEAPQTTSFGSVQAVGSTLFSDYLFAFEATSVVLLVAMAGIVVLAKRRL